MQNLHELAQIFSPAVFHKIVRENDTSLYQKQTAEYFTASSYNSNLDFIKSLYKTLQKEYRCEYIYKNNLFFEIYKKEKLSTTLILNELKLGTSIADLVLLNGFVRIYEIKTELDSLAKLSKQLNDYLKFADEVYVVTDNKYAAKINIEYADTNIGIIVLDAKNKLQTIKEAKKNSLFFCFDTIFKILRKQEYLDLVADNFGFIPDLPNTKIFRACYELLKTVNLLEFQKQVVTKLKERKLIKPNLLSSKKTPKELKYICNSLDFNEKEYYKLYNFLSTNSLCINNI